LSAQTEVRQAAAAAGGSATLFRAADPGACGRFSPLTAALAPIHQRLKNEFDPAGIFNRGRMYAEW
jgi:glycolate oxidase FAD binding subunit